MTTLLALHLTDDLRSALSAREAALEEVDAVASLVVADDSVLVVGADAGAAAAVAVHDEAVAAHPDLPVLVVGDPVDLLGVLSRPRTEVAAGPADLDARLDRLVALSTLVGEAATLRTDVDHLTRQLGRFAVTATHDLKEPLRAVTGFARLLKERYDEALDDSGRTYLNFIDDGAQRLTSMVQALVDFGRASQKELELVEVPVRELLTDVAAAVTPAPSVVAEDGLVVRTDRDLVGRLLQELVDNAVKFRPEERENTVQLTAGLADGHLRIAVVDDGIGVAADDLPRAMDMFGRLHTRERYPGAGIGLAVAAMVAQRLGGELDVESRVGEGTTVTLVLPG